MSGVEDVRGDVERALAALGAVIGAVTDPAARIALAAELGGTRARPTRRWIVTAGSGAPIAVAVALPDPADRTPEDVAIDLDEVMVQPWLAAHGVIRRGRTIGAATWSIAWWRSTWRPGLVPVQGPPWRATCTCGWSSSSATRPGVEMVGGGHLAEAGLTGHVVTVSRA